MSAMNNFDGMRAACFRPVFAGFIALFILQWAGCASEPQEKAAQEDLFIQEIIQAPGKSREECFERAKTWVSGAFSTSLDVIQFTNKSEGLIVAKTEIPHVRPQKYGKDERYSIRFSAVIETRDERMRITLKDFRMIGAFGSTPILKSDMEAVRPSIDATIKSLADSFVQDTRKDAW